MKSRKVWIDFWEGIKLNSGIPIYRILTDEQVRAAAEEFMLL